MHDLLVMGKELLQGWAEMIRETFKRTGFSATHRPSSGLFMKLHFRPEGKPTDIEVVQSDGAQRLQGRMSKRREIFANSKASNGEHCKQTGAAASAQARLLDLLQDPFVTLEQNLLGLVPGALWP
jgi:hypothetical protein